SKKARSPARRKSDCFPVGALYERAFFLESIGMRAVTDRAYSWAIRKFGVSRREFFRNRACPLRVSKTSSGENNRSCLRRRPFPLAGCSPCAIAAPFAAVHCTY